MICDFHRWIKTRKPLLRFLCTDLKCTELSFVKCIYPGNRMFMLLPSQRPIRSNHWSDFYHHRWVLLIPELHMNTGVESYSLQFFSFEVICALGSAVVCSFLVRIYHMATSSSNILDTNWLSTFLHKAFWGYVF